MQVSGLYSRNLTGASAKVTSTFVDLTRLLASHRCQPHIGGAGQCRERVVVEAKPLRRSASAELPSGGQRPAVPAGHRSAGASPVTSFGNSPVLCGALTGSVGESPVTVSGEVGWLVPRLMRPSHTPTQEVRSSDM